MRRFFIRLNNMITRLRNVRAAPDSVLLLLPHCLQNSACEQNISTNPDRCRRCGRCDMAALLDLRDRYGIQCDVVGGGREALQRVKRAGIRAVVAVACEKELADGIRAVFPKPVVAVTNRRPHGPCRDTCVDVDQVESALRSVLAAPGSAVEEKAVGPLQRAEGN